MAQNTATAEEPTYQETQRVAGEIEREVAGVLTETSRQEISIEFDSGLYLPPEAVDIAQRHGFKLHAVFGKHAKFRPADRT
jgi:hypothetical protein